MGRLQAGQKKAAHAPAVNHLSTIESMMQLPKLVPGQHNCHCLPKSWESNQYLEADYAYMCAPLSPAALT
jgi:hypothetical protein